MPIVPIDASDVNKLTSGQVIIELQSVIKELVENSLDAESKQIDVTLKNYGIDGIEVTDRGKGIGPDDFEALCLKHHTSKLASFEDLEKVSTLGFRGEALASLCALANVKITTCTDATYPKATQLEYDHMGKLTSQKTVISGQKSTTVSVQNIFHGLPVRQKYFVKNAKREYSKALSILVSYLLIYTDVRFAIYHISGNTGKKVMVMGTKGQGASILDTLVSVYGSNGTHGLIPIDISTGNIEATYKLGISSVPVSLTFRLRGLILDYSFGMGRGALDRQFLYLNKRPMIHRKFNKIINEVYKAFNHTQLPVFVLDIEIDQTFVDVNVTPDKRSIMVQNEDLVGLVIREELTKFYDGMHNVVPKSDLGVVNVGMSQIASLQSKKKREIDPEGELELEITKIQRTENRPERSKISLSQAFANDTTEATEPMRELSETSDDERDKENSDQEFHYKELDEPDDNEKADAPEADEAEELESDPEDIITSPTLHNHEKKTSTPCCASEAIAGNADRSVDREENDFLMTEEVRLFLEEEESADDTTEATEVSELKVPSTGIDKAPSISLKERATEIHATLSENVDSQAAPDETFELAEGGALTNNTGLLIGPADKRFVEPLSQTYTSESVVGMTKELAFNTDCLRENLHSTTSVKLEKLTEQPSTLVNIHDVKEKLVIQKLDFTNMEIIGQFNLGFIVVRHDNRLFIVDQHASDEIYNYERLHQLLRLRAQPLVVPRILELSPIDEMLVLERQAQLKVNGFIVREAREPQPGRRVELVALPVLKNVVFDDGDLHELVQRLHESGPSKVSTVRCKKVDLMIAMRACRLSIMVGQVLNQSTMKTVVSHLAELDRPWNCPHGRPTMRHLADLEGQGFSEDYDLR